VSYIGRAAKSAECREPLAIEHIRAAGGDAVGEILHTVEMAATVDFPLGSSS
jgi:hypothetical protein